MSAKSSGAPMKPQQLLPRPSLPAIARFQALAAQVANREPDGPAHALRPAIPRESEMLTKVDIDPTKPVEINVVVRSPHATGYRLWAAAPGAAHWVMVGDGNSTDNAPDASTHHFVEGTKLAYWFGIGGNPKTPYRVLLLLGQDGVMLVDGTIIEEGTTDDAGCATAEGWVILQ